MNLESLRIDRSGRGRRRGPRSPWIGRVVLLVVIAGALWLFAGPAFRLLDRIRLPEVDVIRVDEPDPRSAGAVSGKAANGYVVAARRAALSADAPGRIVEMLVREGSVVKRGDVVARLYAEEYEAEVRRAEAEAAAATATTKRARADLAATRAALDQMQRELESAEATVEAAAAREKLARQQRDRARKLLAQEVVTQSEVDEAEAAYDSAEADARAAAARRSAAEAAVTLGESREQVAATGVEIAIAREAAAAAALARAKATLDKTIVRAPFDGVVVLKDAEVGEVVSPNSQGGSSARGSVVTMVDFASLEVQADVPETSLAAVRKGGRARIYLDAFPEDVYEGRVDRIWPTADRQKGTVEVRVVFDTPDERLRPEMGVRVVFLEGDAPAEAADAGPTGPRVPESATVREGDRTGVFVLERDVVRFREVRLGARRGGRVAVESGLTPGERIVDRPPPDLADGDRVRVR